MLQADTVEELFEIMEYTRGLLHELKVELLEQRAPSSLLEMAES